MILVTGATGFVGRHVVARLAGGSEPVRAMVRDRASYRGPDGVEVVEADVTEPETLAAACEGVHSIVHAVAITADIKEPYRGAYEQVNHVGAENLMTAAKAARVSRVVLLSGLGTKPAPQSTYMATRWGTEEAIRRSGIAYAIIQPSIQFGEGAVFVEALARLIRRSPVVPLLGGGSLRFQPIWVEDVVTCIQRALADDALLGLAHTIGGSEYVTFREIINLLTHALHKRRILAPLPLSIARLQARLMSPLMRRPPLTPASLELFGFDNVTDLDSVEKRFGFKPRGFREYIGEHGVE